MLLYDSNRVPTGAGDLGGHADPLVIEQFGGALVVADFDGLTLYRVARDGRHLGPFGSGALAQELAAARAQQRAAPYWKIGGWVGLALTMVVGFALALRHGARPRWLGGRK